MAIYRIRFNIPPVIRATEIITPADLSMFTAPSSLRRTTKVAIQGKNMAGMMAAGHPECQYVATVCPSFPVDMINKIRNALTIGGPTFIHCLAPCPKGWGFDPSLSHEIGILAVETGVWPLYEIKHGKVQFYGKSKGIVDGGRRKPVRQYLEKQDRFSHLTEEDIDYYQSSIDDMWQKWQIPGVIPVSR